MTVLVVEDDAVYRAALGRALRREGLEVAEADSVEAGISAAEKRPDLAVVDLQLGDGSGIDVLRALTSANPACRAVLLTGHGTIPATVEAMRAGAIDVRTKPISTAELLEALLRTESLRVLPTPLDLAEREHILRVLDACGGNISEAARRLGLHRRTLQRKLYKMPSSP